MRPQAGGCCRQVELSGLAFGAEIAAKQHLQLEKVLLGAIQSGFGNQEAWVSRGGDMKDRCHACSIYNDQNCVM